RAQQDRKNSRSQRIYFRHSAKSPPANFREARGDAVGRKSLHSKKPALYSISDDTSREPGKGTDFRSSREFKVICSAPVMNWSGPATVSPGRTPRIVVQAPRGA